VCRVIASLHAPATIPEHAELIAKSGKHYFSRARPFIASSDVQPTVPVKPGDAYDSYPSGHATFGYMSAILLAQMVPEKRDALFARGREFGANRVVDGVHYPSDVEAGRIDGTLVAAALWPAPISRRPLPRRKQKCAPCWHSTKTAPANGAQERLS
jgi:acid phosphatase (class A)